MTLTDRGDLRREDKPLKRILGVTIVVILLVILIGAGIIYSWTFTPQGRLDLEAAVVLRFMPFSEELSVEQERESFRRATRLLPGSPVPIARVDDMHFMGPDATIPIRVYWPETDRDLPILLYFHGGGFRFGDLDTHDGICRSLAEKAGTLVVSVDYRLAPEHPFPAAVDDCFAALEWVHANAGSINGDKSRIAVAGDSAGGNLAATTALKSRDLGGPEILFQLLIYPRTNMATNDTRSWRNLGEDYIPTQKMAARSVSLYLPEPTDRQNPYASPLLAEDHSNLPPLLLITAEFDPLRDEGEAYARKLAAAGVSSRIQQFDGVIHGFLSIPIIRKSEMALTEAATALRQAFKRCLEEVDRS
jgi:acetyl esterase